MNGDEKAIRQLVTILLDNAVKHSNDGGRIELTREKQKNLIRMRVFNTADSVPKESIAHFLTGFIGQISREIPKLAAMDLGALLHRPL